MERAEQAHSEEPQADASGAVRWVETIRTPILDDDGRVTGIAGIARDVTERKRAEAQLHRAERQLRLVQKQEVVGRLAGGIAHDFDKILNVIVGHTELLLRRVARSEEHRVRSILEAAQRAAGLARQLMAFGRPQAVQPRVLSLDGVLVGLSSVLRRVIGEHVELDVRAGCEGKVEADPGQLEQVVLNLVINARDAMPQGGKLTIETRDAVLEQDQDPEPALPAGSFVLLRVADTGRGMHAETVGRVFEPFFTTKPDGQGSGLGLAMVHEFVRQLGGVVEVESRIGEGTAFSIYLLRAAETAPVADEPMAVAPSAEGHETVLIVEDEELARDMLRETVEMLGYRVWVAANGEGALEILRGTGGSIDVLVMDVVMPGLSGIELARRAVAAWPDLCCVYVAGYPLEVISNHGGLPEGVPFLPKPFAPEALGRCPRRALDGRRAGPATANGPA
jgi:signal transduction histidine kinase